MRKVGTSSYKDHMKRIIKELSTYEILNQKCIDAFLFHDDLHHGNIQVDFTF